MFLAIFAGGVLGGVIAVKNKISGNWLFLVSAVFSTYFAILLSTELLEYLKDLADLPPAIINGGAVIVLFFILMIIINKILKSVAEEDEGEYFANLPEIPEKIVNFVIGFLSGFILFTFFIFCAFVLFPDALSGSDFEIKKARTSSVRGYASNLLQSGNILTLSCSYSGKQEALLKKLLPVPVEKKKPDKISQKKLSAKDPQKN